MLASLGSFGMRLPVGGGNEKMGELENLCRGGPLDLPRDLIVSVMGLDAMMGNLSHTRFGAMKRDTILNVHGNSEGDDEQQQSSFR